MVNKYYRWPCHFTGFFCSQTCSKPRRHPSLCTMAALPLGDALLSLNEKWQPILLHFILDKKNCGGTFSESVFQLANQISIFFSFRNIPRNVDVKIIHNLFIERSHVLPTLPHVSCLSLQDTGGTWWPSYASGLRSRFLTFYGMNISNGCHGSAFSVSHGKNRLPADS